jgi:hypothetical protein
MSGTIIIFWKIKTWKWHHFFIVNICWAFLLLSSGCSHQAAAISLKSVIGKIDVLTYHYNNLRNGVNDSETILTPQNVNSGDFGKLFDIGVEGDVYAQPLYKSNLPMPDGRVYDVLFVATAHDSLYAIDAASGTVLWQNSFIDAAGGIIPVPAADTGTDDITPEVGIIGTPVIDPDTLTIYLVSKVKNNSTQTYAQYIHAIDITNGQEKFNGPALISAEIKNAAGNTISFNALLANQRSALLLVKGNVIIAWASHGDNGDYHGWLMGYNAQDLSRQPAVLMTTPNGTQGGIWMAGGGCSSDGTSVFTAVGNGTSDMAKKDYGNSALKVESGTLKVIDSFSVYNSQSINNSDADFGSTQPLLIPANQSGTSPLLITADKNGTIYVLIQNTLGGFNANKNNDLQEISVGSTPIMNNMAFFNNHLYVGPNNLPLESFELSRGKFGAKPVSSSIRTFGNGGEDGEGANPVISSNRLADGIVWALDNSNVDNGETVLYAYDANALTKELYNSTQNLEDNAGPAIVFTAPLVVNGKVFVPGTGLISVYGLK